MPLYLRPPRKGLTPNWQIRGTYLGIKILGHSTGTPKRSVALTQLRRLEKSIEAGEYPADERRATEGYTFLTAAISYMQQGGERRYIKPLLEHFGEASLPLTQEAIDEAALALRPGTSAATRARCVYVPISAIQRHSMGEDKAPVVRMPRGAKGKIRTDFLSPEDASAIIKAAHPDLGLLLQFLLYTGCRLGEALALRWDEIDLDKRLAWVRTSKNGDPRTVLLREDLRDALASSRGGESAHQAATAAEIMGNKPSGRKPDEGVASLPREAVFKYHQGGHLKWLLRRATLKACGISAPERRPDDYQVPPHRLQWVNFHTYRHTFATWLRRYGGTDTQGLVATGNWRDPRSAARYAHVIARDEWEKVDKLPKVAPTSGSARRAGCRDLRPAEHHRDDFRRSATGAIGT